MTNFVFVPNPIIVKLFSFKNFLFKKIPNLENFLKYDIYLMVYLFI